MGEAYRILGLITFFTAVGDKEVRARSLRQGSTALDAAGRVHTDMQRGFVRADGPVERLSSDDLRLCLEMRARLAAENAHAASST